MAPSSLLPPMVGPSPREVGVGQTGNDECSGAESVRQPYLLATAGRVIIFVKRYQIALPLQSW